MKVLLVLRETACYDISEIERTISFRVNILSAYASIWRPPTFMQRPVLAAGALLRPATTAPRPCSGARPPMPTHLLTRVGSLSLPVSDSNGGGQGSGSDSDRACPQFGLLAQQWHWQHCDRLSRPVQSA